MMLLSKLKVGLAALLSAAVVAGGSGLLIAAQGPGDKPAAGAPAQAQVPAPDDSKPVFRFQTRPAAELARDRIDAAEKRLREQKAFYVEGRITIDRLIDASRSLMQARLDAATARPDRVQAAAVHYEQMQDILKKEQSELEVGRATEADVAEARSSLLEAEFTLAREVETPQAKPIPGDAKADPGPAPVGNPKAITRLAAERVEAARIVLAEASRLFPSEITVDDYLAASKLAADADLDAASTPDGRRAAIQAQVDRLRRAQASVQGLLLANEKKASDGWRVRLDLLGAEVALAKEVAGTATPAPADLERRLSELERKVDRILSLIDAAKR